MLNKNALFGRQHSTQFTNNTSLYKKISQLHHTEVLLISDHWDFGKMTKHNAHPVLPICMLLISMADMALIYSQ